jgi:hypothetical protein
MAISRCRAVARASSKVGQVRARDEQHETGRGEQDPERRFVLFAELGNPGPRGLGDQAERQVLRHAHLRVVGRERRAEQVGGDRGKVRGRAVDRPAGLAPLVVVVQERLGTDRQRDVEAAPHFDPVESTRGDADDDGPMTRERDRLPDGRRVSRVRALPERVAQHGARFAPAGVVGGAEQAARGGANAEDVEEPAAHPEAVGRVVSRVGRRARSGVCREIEFRRAPRERARERLLAVADRLPDRVRDGDVPAVEVAAGAVRIGEADFDETRRIRDGQRLEPERVHDFEERRVGADAERERDDRDRGESGIVPEHAQRVANVLGAALDPAPAPRVARGLLDL